MTEAGAALVWCPFPNSDIAREAAKTLLKEKHIACANIFPVVESLFEWKGEISSSQEVGALFKTTGEKIQVVVTRLGEIHPYETPAILGWHCDTAFPATLSWLEESVQDNY